jgi:hypothetical protein
MSSRSERRAARRAARNERPARADRPTGVDKKRALAEAALANVPVGEPETAQARGFETCPCPKDCVLHGECLLCVAYHGRRDRLPRCLR